MFLETEWKNYKITDLFDCVQSKGDNQAKDLEAGDIPLISAGKSNNGVVKLILTGDGKSEIFNSGVITADMFGNCFYQPYNFYAVSHGRVSMLLPKYNEINENVSLFICRILEHNFSIKYSYNRMLSLEKLTNEYVYLPKGTNNLPNWELINSFVLETKEKAKKESERIISISNGDKNTIELMSGKINAEEFDSWAGITKNEDKTIDLSKWTDFKISDIFQTFTGGDLIIGNVTEGDIPVVSHSATNNSVKIYSDVIPNKRIFDCSKTISLADRGTFFATIQPENFYIGTRVKALVSKYDDITREALMFISTIINNESYRFTYGRNCTGGLDNLIIKLPYKKTENKIIPDFEWMTAYIKALQYSKKINCN